MGYEANKAGRLMKGTSTETAMEITLVDMAWLKPHEEIQPERVTELQAQFEASGHVDLPLLVDRVTGTILDGHHRFSVGQALGLARMPPCSSITSTRRGSRWTPGRVAGGRASRKRKSSRWQREVTARRQRRAATTSTCPYQ